MDSRGSYVSRRLGSVPLFIRDILKVFKQKVLTKQLRPTSIISDYDLWQTLFINSKVSDDNNITFRQYQQVSLMYCKIDIQAFMMA